MASIGRLVDSPITTACRGGSMRVLHVSSGNLYGGIETLLLTLARHRNLCPGLDQHFALCFEGRLSEELAAVGARVHRSEEHTSELQSRLHLVCRLLLEKKKVQDQLLKLQRVNKNDMERGVTEERS